MQLISAQYTLEPHNDYAGTMPSEDEKLVVITYAIKNSRSSDNSTGGYLFTLVDENEKNYDNGSGSTRLSSTGTAETYFNLKPSQGIGQDPKNRLSVAIPVPGKAKIKKIIVKQGRKAVASEDILRYPISGTNKIVALPSYVADPADPTGATALSPAVVKAGEFYPNGYAHVRFDGLTEDADCTVNGQKAADGKRFVIANFTSRNATLKKLSFFDVDSNQFETMRLRDTDGEKYQTVVDSHARKAKSDELVASDYLEPQEEIHYRLIFELPKSVKPKSLDFGGGKYGHAYRVNL